MKVISAAIAPPKRPATALASASTASATAAPVQM
jgi:hypothetical protein